MAIRYFDTEREAEKAKRKFAKYKTTPRYRWTVQGNSLVRIPNYKRRKK